MWEEGHREVPPIPIMVTSPVKEMMRAKSGRDWLLYVAIGITLWAFGAYAYLSSAYASNFLNGFVAAGLLVAPFICTSFVLAYLLFSALDYFSGGGVAVWKALVAILLALFWGFWLLALRVLYEYREP